MGPVKYGYVLYTECYGTDRQAEHTDNSASNKKIPKNGRRWKTKNE